MYVITFDINETDKKFIANWSIDEVHGVKPQPRTSHSCVAYKSQYLIIIAGEGYDSNDEKVPLNDVWLYNISAKAWSEIKIVNPNIFDGRLCNSACIYGERVYVYGGNDD
jgi:N-acetylneuraminic acid mutarotase